MSTTTRIPAIVLSRPVAPAAAPPLTKWRVLAFIAMVFGMFMAILDIQIVSASLSDIQAGLSASSEEIAWVQTSYLIAEVVMIPLSGLLSRALSTRIMFALSAAGFTVMSVMCARATSIEEMIVWRALQGFIGGGMIPTVFAAAFTIFPKDKQPIISPIIGLVATLAPTVGPTIGGYLTELFSWHWLFLVNVIPGILVTLAAWFLIDFDEPQWNLLRGLDWLGLAALALCLGSLEYVLEEGSSKDWYQSPLITWATVATAIGALILAWRIRTQARPIVDLWAFRDRNFASGCLMSFAMGIGLYGLTYLYPIYLARVRGFSSLQIGETLFLTGVCMFLTAPVVGILSRKVDPRLLIAIGFIGFGIGTWQASFITKDWSFNELIVPQVLRGCSLMLCMVPITNVALGTLPLSRLKDASGVFNLTRNLGGAVGLALINTVLGWRTDLHTERLREHVIWGRNVVDETLAGLSRSLDVLGSDAQLAALKRMSGLVRREGLTMALSDVFILLTVLFVSLSLLAALMQKPKIAPGGGGGH